MIDKKNGIDNRDWIKVNIIMILILNAVLSYSNPKQIANNALLNSHVQEQAGIMGRAFVKGDYQTFSKYTYPPIVNAMGGESRMTNVLANTAISMKAQGMAFDAITFDKPTKIVKRDDELQCTLQQHTTIKLANGRAVVTSTLIAISKDGGKNWFFVDTSDKSEAEIRKALPNLSTAITIPAQAKPVYYKD